MNRLRASVVLLVMLTAVSMGFAGEYKVIQRIPLPGDGGWDLLTADAGTRRLYISHSTEVQVLDLDTLKPVGVIKDTPGVHGIAISSSTGRGFISCGKSNRITVFDLKTLGKTGEITTGQKPDVVTLDPATGRVFAFNAGSNDATVVDAANSVSIATVSLSGKPEFAVADGMGRIYCNLEDKNSLAEIDSQNSNLIRTTPMDGCEEPSALVFDHAHNRLFAGCGNRKMVAINATDGKVVGTAPIGDHVDGGVFDAERGLLFFSNGDGTLTEIHVGDHNEYKVVANIPTQRGARTVALDPKSHRLFLPTAEFGPTPPATSDAPHPRPVIVPGTFTLLVVGEE